MRSTAKNTPAPAASTRPRRGRGPRRRSSRRAMTARTGIAYTHRKMAAVVGETSACLTRMEEKAIASAPQAAIARGRAASACSGVGDAVVVMVTKARERRAWTALSATDRLSRRQRPLASPPMDDVEIREDVIRLGQFLKLAGLVASGAE